ncbi:hypothetical protein DWB77_02115 [Streptomyces hundungensis]|uniref:DUF3168 domain-containing protein n=1 Tax=Streptomyces hundungensis TaxID=1077946 RepID=A0A387H842_9ACTN|nr:DUF3168 domain-containing protein [Streptomyces hundungensis]AYG79995.1 hypothetical protein DWB77_02115 [Streptomyces hundungensis]
MRIDPVAVVFAFLSARKDLAGHVTGDLVGREPSETTIYLEHAGGHRVVRDRMDRADITYQVYAEDRSVAAELAYRVREALLEELPGRAVGEALVLDAAEAISPRYFPDTTSREHTYQGEVTVFITDS